MDKSDEQLKIVISIMRRLKVSPIQPISFFLQRGRGNCILFFSSLIRSSMILIPSSDLVYINSFSRSSRKIDSLASLSPPTKLGTNVHIFCTCFYLVQPTQCARMFKLQLIKTKQPFRIAVITHELVGSIHNYGIMDK